MAPVAPGTVNFSTTGGTFCSSQRVLRFSPLPPPADTRMQNQEVDLSPYKGTPFKLRYRFDGGTTVNFLILSVGWWVDDITVDGATWTQIGTPSTTSLNITNHPSSHYYYRVRGVYTNGNTTNNSNVQDIIVNAGGP